MHRIVIANAAARDIRRIRDRRARRRLVSAIERLSDDPYPTGASKLGGVGDVWRIRGGDWRICYLVERGRLVFLVLIVGRRGDVYDRLRQRLGQLRLDS